MTQVKLFLTFARRIPRFAALIGAGRLMAIFTIGGMAPLAASQSNIQQNRQLRGEVELAQRAADRLRRAWTNFYLHPPKPSPPPKLFPQALLPPHAQLDLEKVLPIPQRLSVALASTAKFLEPDVLRSRNGLLHVTLEAAYATTKIGNDPVHLRLYNGKLVGPTLRVRPGDTIYLTLKNSMPVEGWLPNMMNTLNLFNTTNIHFHGLEVSPDGISDNVLIELGPHATQQYEVHIPSDHPCGTFWYHPHRHGSTAGDVASGMSGALIVEGKDLDTVPEIKAARERIMVLNQIPYLYKNTLPDPNTGGPPMHHFDLPYGEVEAKYADYLFGPGDWPDLNRYTTVNGVTLPVLRMAPGSVERWRIVDSGQRENINLQIAQVPRKNQTRKEFTIRQIAVDGLALGKLQPTTNVELWPGYRSDLLVKAPMSNGEYVVYNGGSPPQDSIDGEAVHLNYIAKIVVSGTPHSMRLPTDREVASFRRPWISDKAITGHQSAVYGILVSHDQVVFTIDGKSFDMQAARELKLGDVDEWTIQSKNDVGFVTHPFHIHVNPFEVTSIVAPVMDGSKQKVDGNGKPVFQELLKDGPVWRDTVKIPGGGWVKMRTKYERFTGTFVQHCHILDHEDQGMMQLIDIYDKNKPSGALIPMSSLNQPAPVALLPDANGTLQSVTGPDSKPTVLFFIRGEGCAHCALQVAVFRDHIDEFRRLGMQIIGVTSDNVAAVKAAFASDPSPFPMLADPKGAVFAKYGCVSQNGILHGTFILDGSHRVLWRTVGASPYLGVEELLRIGQGLATTAAAQPPLIGASKFARVPAATTNH